MPKSSSCTFAEDLKRKVFPNGTYNVKATFLALHGYDPIFLSGSLLGEPFIPKGTF